MDMVREYCGPLGLESMPLSPATMAQILSGFMLTTSSATELEKTAAIISQAHIQQGHPDPALSDPVRNVLRQANQNSTDITPAPLSLRCINTLMLQAHSAEKPADRNRMNHTVALVLLYLETALFSSDIAEITWQDVQTDQDHRPTVLIPSTGQSNISPLLAEYLQLTRPEMAQPTDPVFAMPKSTIRDRISSACHKAGLSKKYSLKSCSIGRYLVNHLAGTNPAHDHLHQTEAFLKATYTYDHQDTSG